MSDENRKLELAIAQELLRRGVSVNELNEAGLLPELTEAEATQACENLEAECKRIVKYLKQINEGEDSKSIHGLANFVMNFRKGSLGKGSRLDTAIEALLISSLWATVFNRTTPEGLTTYLKLIKARALAAQET